jgi:endogenous inhibitor of DNA gyrase (YacG/DUF329 family)
MRCPICKSPVDESRAGKPGSYFPFCSERCKLVDLGRWLGGKYQIPVVEKDESDSPTGADFHDDDDDDH